MEPKTSKTAAQACTKGNGSCRTERKEYLSVARGKKIEYPHRICLVHQTVCSYCDDSIQLVSLGGASVKWQVELDHSRKEFNLSGRSGSHIGTTAPSARDTTFVPQLSCNHTRNLFAAHLVKAVGLSVCRYIYTELLWKISRFDSSRQPVCLHWYLYTLSIPSPVISVLQGSQSANILLFEVSGLWN